MHTKIGDRMVELNDTATARKLKRRVNLYIETYRLNRRRDPERVALTAAQARALGVDVGFVWPGSSVKVEVV
jgi:hypothetical protein